MSDRTLLRAVLAGLAVAAAAVGVYVGLILPGSGRADESRLYDYTYASGKSENVDFVLANKSSDGILCFGSSEFYISKDTVAECPQAVFGEDNYCGVDMTYIGEGYDQSLWQAIAEGAYAGSSDEKKVVLFVSPQWFFQGNGDQDKFSSKFSYTLYSRFCDNPDISNETKAYVRERVLELGVDEGTVAAANDDTLVDWLNDQVYTLGDSLSLRSKIDHIVSISPTKSSVRVAGQDTGEPDWEALLAQATADGDAATSSNDYGILDSYWEKNGSYRKEATQNFHEADEEYADFSCFLDVANECGLEPLVVILPVHGQWYDLCGFSSDERQAYYQKIRDICDEHGVAYADFSSCEYEKYFLCDTVHPGWRGWVHIEEAIYDFANDTDDQWLGGANYGVAEGLGEEASSDGQ